MPIRRPANLALTIAATVSATLLVVLTLNRSPLAFLFAVPLVLFLPGYALTFALFRKDTVGVAERLVLSLGLSIAVTILCGLALDLTTEGLLPTMWLVLLGEISLVACLVAWMRGHEPLMTTSRINLFKPRVGDVLLYGFAILAVVAALQIAGQPASADRVEGYSALWMVPSRAGNARVVNFGFASQETGTETYRLELQVNSAEAKEWNDIVLEPGESWSKALDLSSSTVPVEKVEALLYRMDRPGEIYRRVALQP